VLHPPVILTLMQTQLALMPRETTPRHGPAARESQDWRIDDETRRTARLGLEQARHALQEAIRRTAA
jgi:hypothetical protein